MTQRLLLVCHANVCRSRVMQWTLGSLVSADAVTLASAGTHALRPDPICDVALDVLGDDVPPANRTSGAVQLTAEAIDGADLIITATKHQRGEIALMSHDARDRTFTLREALLLGDLEGPSGPAHAGSDLRAYAALLHGRRGRLQFAPASKLRRTAADPLDHVDVHQERGRSHRKGLVAVQNDARGLAAQLRNAIGL
ncbi:MAG TPA: hypothetical protein VN035_08185 [Microbacterium sp.]|nr:hypothetical protein [Microbacterium sp.]